MADESLDTLNDDSRKSEGKEIDTVEQTSTDPESIVNEIRSESPQTKQKKGEKTTKGNKTLASYSIPFILHTIDQYDKHLKTSDKFRGILTDESLDLLSTLTLESEHNKQLVSYLFCVYHYAPEGIADVDFPKTLGIDYDCTSLYERRFITFNHLDDDESTVEHCVKRLTVLQIQEEFENFGNISQDNRKTPQKMKTEFIQKYHTRDMKEFSDYFTGDRKSEVLNKLRSKVKKWKLSDLARETITELTVLMHLDSIFTMGCSIDFTHECNGRPVLNFKPSGKIKNYPVHKEMILDNATIIFRDRNEFCAYLNALALSEEYKAAADKCEFVLRVCQLYRDVNTESMSYYIKLPIWLRRFTPINIYVDILDDVVKHLKKLKKYNKALEILDLLIAQVAFKQDNKANWYDMKSLIQLRCLKSPEKAALTLYEAFFAGLPVETIIPLRLRAKHIVEFEVRSQIDDKILKVLRFNAKSKMGEHSIRDPHYHYQEPAVKSDSKTRSQYKWENILVSSETLCCNIYKDKQSFTLVEHWEGNLMNAIYFMLFWDIIYTKPLAIGGIFLSHYQQYPLDMWCENFYINRKARIDDLLTKIQNGTVDDIMNMITDRYDELVQYDVPEISRKMINLENIKKVVHCLGPRALFAICRRLAHNYNYMRYGFPDLTLCNTEDCTIEFREVKTTDNVQPNQIQWLHYLNENNIKAGFCYLSNKKGQDNKQEAANEDSFDSSYSLDNDDPQPGLSSSLI